MWPSTFSIHFALCTDVCDEQRHFDQACELCVNFAKFVAFFFLLAYQIVQFYIVYSIFHVILHHFMHFHVHVRNSRGRTYALRPLSPSLLPPNELNCKNKQTTKLLLAHSSQVHQFIY